jgi:pantothenate kinase
VHGYVALLHRLRADTRYPIYVPDYDRTVDAPIAARLVVMPDVRLIVTEGNYLASDEPVWRDVRTMLDELWYLETPDEVREARLIERQLAGGRSLEQAVAWVANNDRPNGELVKESNGNCTRVVSAASNRESRRTRTSG